MARLTCTKCESTVRGEPHTTVTGRRLCDACWTELNGTAAGLLATGGVGGATATAGWLERVRRARGSVR